MFPNHLGPGCSGTTTITHALSVRIFCNMAGIHSRGGKAYSSPSGHLVENASTPRGGFSTGLIPNHSGHWAVPSEAKRSISAFPKCCHIRRTNRGFSFHSDARGPPRDIRSAPLFSFPGMCLATSDWRFTSAHSSSSTANRCTILDLTPPCLFMYATVVRLSDLTNTSLPLMIINDAISIIIELIPLLRHAPSNPGRGRAQEIAGLVNAPRRASELKPKLKARQRKRSKQKQQTTETALVIKRLTR